MAAPHDVYFNLHTFKFSVVDRSNGRVAYHADSLTMVDVTFVVQPAGRKRAVQQKKRNVHAYARGRVLKVNYPTDLQPSDTLDSVRYNPFRSDKFLNDDSDPIANARIAYLQSDGAKGSILIPSY